MAGFKLTVGFLFILVCFASVPSVNGYCSSNSQCSPGICIQNRCLCPDGSNEPDCAATGCDPACRNGGICRGIPSFVYCDCPNGTSGSYCQYSGCSPTCQNGGLCYRSSSYTPYCHCLTGYSGKYCQNSVRTCSPACQNGGSCHATYYSAHCDCPSGYTGSYCEYRVCSPSCENGGTCRTNGVCYCPSGYGGSHCQVSSSSSSECFPTCRNGGTCTSSGDCDCAPGYSGSYCQYSSTSSPSTSRGSTGIVVGGVFGGIVFISCIVGITLLRVCLRIAAIQRRTQNIEATQVPHPGTGRRVILLRRVCRVPATNPDAPPPYVPSANIQSSDPPPYTTNSANCPLHVSVEDTPTPQPLLPEAPPSNPIEDPPEYLPPPGRDQDREPLLAEEQ